MLESVKQQLNQLGIAKEEPILLAVSGGVDSMVLWHLLNQIGQNHAVAHVNFCLRAEDSDADEKLVQSEGEKKQITVHCKRARTKQYAEENNLSIQMAAREIRYEWFDKLKEEFTYNTIVTAHHLEDSIETFFINLNRGTGIKGLTGITSNIQRFRPLLNFSKTEIREYAKKYNVAFREDVSNESIQYERNWFRHEILGPWKEHNPQFLESMKLTLSRLQSTDSSLAIALEGEIQKIKSESTEGKISLQNIENLKHPKEVLYEVLSPQGFSEDQLESLLIAIKQKAVGKVFHAPDFAMQLDRSYVLIQSRKEIQQNNTQLIFEHTSKVEGPIELSIKILDASSFQLKTGKQIEGFDLDKLEFPLELRSWQKGDYMTPLGMQGSKKISDILIDEKVPLFEKEKVHVLCSNQEIVWLIGLRISEKFKVDKQSKNVLQLEWKGN